MPEAKALPDWRALRMALLGLGVSGSYSGYLLQRLVLGKARSGTKLKAAHGRAARRVRHELQTLRGPVMKLGQALSLHTEAVPEEILAELLKLQMEAPAMHPSLMRARFKASLGRAPEEVFREFEPEPFAAASLGQVHRAVLKDGRVAAVKIQYPGIEDAIRNDFRWLRRLSAPLQASGHLPASVVDEAEEQILAETDYRREASHLDLFRRRLEFLPFVSVPEVFRECSTDRVIAMSLLPGQHLEAFLSGRPTQRLRDEIGTRLLELFSFQLLDLGVLHADPHWGNYLFNADGTIGLIDFGCVKHLRPPFLQFVRRICLYPGAFDSPEYRRLLDDGYAAAGEKLSPAAREAFIDIAERCYRRMYPPAPEDASRRFDFGDAAFLRDYAVAAERILRSKGAVRDALFLTRAEVGLYTTLHRLRARVPASAVVRRYLDRSSPGAPDGGDERDRAGSGESVRNATLTKDRR